jgi:sarcosine oxidase
VLVVGLGAMGASVLRALARRGVTSAVGIDRFAPPHAHGSSHGGTRAIRTAYFESPRYLPLLARSWELWNELAPDADLLVRTGVLHVGPAAHPAMQSLRASLADLPHELLDEAGVRARGIEPAPGDLGVFEEQGGFLRPEACIRELLRGARIHSDETVVAIDDALRVHLASGRVLEADTIVLAAGPWNAAQPALRRFFGDAPLVATRQPQLYFAHPPEPSRTPVFIHFTAAGTFYGIPPADPGGPMKVCSHEHGRRTDPDLIERAVTADDTAPVEAYVRAHHPALGALASASICMYTSTPDEHFVVGRSPVDPRVILASACSGHGFKMAIGLGEAIAELVLDGRSRLDLELFDPARFRS